MTFHEFEIAALCFSLGVVARPLLRLWLDQHAEDQARRADLARIEQRRRAGLPTYFAPVAGPGTPPSMPIIDDPAPLHPSRSVLPPRYVLGRDA